MNRAPTRSRSGLTGLRPSHDALVGVDSDGCVFDTMEAKQKQCFHPAIIEHWGLQAVADELRAAAEFVNLHSRWRGQNRFVCLVRTFDFLRRHPGVARAGVAVPRLDAVRRLIESGAPLSNDALRERAEQTGDPELESLLAWSLHVNAVVAQRVRHVPPFAWARRCLERMARDADLVCVSQTPLEALQREWAASGLGHLLRAIGGQEAGTKAEQLATAARGGYAPGRVLMIGDAPGDREAAQAVAARFYPILPGAEEAAWQRLHDEAYDRFRKGEYTVDYERALISEFEALLPENPPWVG